MRTPTFHDRLATRLAAVFGVSSLALGYATSSAACKTPVHATSTAATSGTTGVGGADGGAVSASTGFGDAPMPGPDPIVQQCATWPPIPNDAMVIMYPDSGTIDPGTGCPSDSATILVALDPFACPTGWEAREVISGPTLNAMNQCCYQVGIHICVSGGRPFLAGAHAITAPALRSGSRGWSGERRPDVTNLSPRERTLLADAWVKDALFEHASVASFGRFALALLAVGAPADLVEGAHRAALDEIRHARLCFALASAYAGEERQPGAFPLGDSVTIEASLAAIAASTVREGCIGETIAAMRAAEQLARAEDPAVREALATIAEDEARHAELAWRTVLWAVREGGPEVREAVRAAFAEVTSGTPSAVKTDGNPVLAAHGLLDEAETHDVAMRAIAQLIVPASALLLETAISRELEG